MKLLLTLRQKHTDTATAVAWTSSNDLFTCGDDRTIFQWAHGSEHVTSVMTLPDDTYPTCMDWLPATGGAGVRRVQSDLFALGCTDGKVRFVNRAGRVEKIFDAHRGAIIDIRWSYDGAALLTGGEDGCVKVWSRSGMLRSALVQSSVPIYACTWNATADLVLYTNSKQLVLKPLQPNSKVEQWKAHDGLVLSVDWSAVHGSIVSGGEDRRVRVWDSYGRALYSSAPHDHPITAVKWSPDGSLFAAGAFNTLRLCDQTGWSHSLEKPSCGSILRIAWTDDGTKLAAAGSSGAIVFANIVEKKVEWKNYAACLSAPDCVLVRDIAHSASEKLEFRDHVVQLSVGYGYLVVATVTQCYVYKVGSWLNPVVFDLPKEGTISLLQQSDKYILMVDTQEGVQVYGYEGRLVCTPRMANARGEALNSNTLAISSDVLAVRDHRDERVVHIYDVQSAKVVGKPLTHAVPVQQIALSAGPLRFLALVDSNRSLYITPVLRSDWKPEKLGTMVLSAAWHDSTPMLAAFCDGRLSVWTAPGAIYVDKSLAASARLDFDAGEYGKAPIILSFVGDSIIIRRSEGTRLVASVPVHAPLLLGLLQERKWDQAARLCRFIKSKQMWSVMAAYAATARDVIACENAFAALGEVDKVQFLQSVKAIPSGEGRAAAMCVFSHQPDEAEQILLQAGLIYRAIDLNCSLNRWERALDLAVKHKTHVDTVAARRQRYLHLLHRAETDPKFASLAGSVDLNWEQIERKVEQELDAERTRPGAKPFA